MPVLARTLEAAGLSTILVTNMPFWAEKTGVPRTLAVEFPYAHALGMPNQPEMQRRVIIQALAALEKIREPGEIIHSPEEWPIPKKEALASWQPTGPSPIVGIMSAHVREVIGRRRKRKSN